MKQTTREKIISRLKRIDIGWWTQYLLVGSMFLLHGLTIIVHLVQGKLDSNDAWRAAVLVWVFNFHAAWSTCRKRDIFLKQVLEENITIVQDKNEQDIILQKLCLALERVDKNILSKYGIHISKNEPL